MKNIAIVSFLVLALSACSGDAAKCEGNCADTCKVAAPAVDTTVAVAVDTTAASTTTAATETTSVK